VSRQALNARLQLLLNSKAEKVSGSPFWVNDKVINQRNSWLPFQSHDADALVNKYNEVYVANGEIGSVVSCEPKRFTVQLESPRREVIVPRGDSDNGQTGCDWDLGYAISVHKSQGSEFPFVFVMLDEYPGAAMVYSREWLYTAISRASKSCILIGREELAKAMCRRVIHNERKTFLCELIKERLNYGKAQEEISAGRATAYQGDGATSREWH
jgi:exodeoxyribonuclease V alpha subunit